MPGLFARVGDYLQAAWRSLLSLPAVLRIYLSLLARSGPAHRRAVERMTRAAREAPGDPEPVRSVGPGLFQVDPAFLGAGAGVDDATVLHLLGTGEHVYSPLPGLRAMCEAEPRLRALRHVVVDTPAAAACFLGPDEFATRLRRALEPELRRNRERLVVVGLSRGAVAALELGTHVAEAHGTRVGILAMSPPLSPPEERPPTVDAIGGLEDATDAVMRQVTALPLLGPLFRPLLRYLYVRVCGFALTEIGMASPETLALYGRYLRQDDPGRVCLRAVREFALLGRISSAELRHALSGCTARLARRPAVRAELCWGEDDVWINPTGCFEHVRQTFEQRGVPPELARLSLLEGWNHGVGRQADVDYAPLATRLWSVCEHAFSDDAPLSKGATNASSG